MCVSVAAGHPYTTPTTLIYSIICSYPTVSCYSPNYTQPPAHCFICKNWVGSRLLALVAAKTNKLVFLFSPLLCRGVFFTLIMICEIKLILMLNGFTRTYAKELGYIGKGFGLDFISLALE